jgi:hypothetical protein
MEDWKFT